MKGLESLRELFPNYAKDVRLTLESAVARSPLPLNEAAGCALAAALTAGSATLVRHITDSGMLNATEIEAAKAAAAIMAMNNIWYRYVELSGDKELRAEEPELRMSAYATHGGTDERRFTMWVLSASIVGGCRSCIASHAAELREIGLSVGDLREIGRIAAAVNAAAKVLVSEGH